MALDGLADILASRDDDAEGDQQGGGEEPVAAEDGVVDADCAPLDHEPEAVEDVEHFESRCLLVSRIWLDLFSLRNVDPSNRACW